MVYSQWTDGVSGKITFIIYMIIPLSQWKDHKNVQTLIPLTQWNQRRPIQTDIYTVLGTCELGGVSTGTQLY